MFEIKPKTRKEIYMAYLAGNLSLELPEPMTRDEVTLYNLCQSHAYGTAEVYLLPETEVELFDQEGMMANTITLSDALKEGQVYTVTVDGSEYKCTCVFIEGVGFNGIGNAMVFGGDDTGEPFAVMDTGIQTVFVSLEGASSAVVSIRGVADVSLPTRYAPEPVLLDLVALGAPTLRYIEYGSSYIAGIAVDMNLLATAFRTGFIKVRMEVDFPGRPNMSFGTSSIDPVEGEVVFTAPVKIHDGSYLIETTLYDAGIFMKVQPNATLSAGLYKMAVYNPKDNSANLYPSVSN